MSVPLWVALIVLAWLVVIVGSWRILRAPRGLDAFGWPASLDVGDGIVLVALWGGATIFSLSVALVHAWGWL